MAGLVWTILLVTYAVDTTSNTTANVVTAAAAVITALGGLAIGVSLLVTAVRTKQKVEAMDQAVGTVHTIVNQSKTDADRFNIALTEHGKSLSALLDAAGIPHPTIPIDQSKPVVGERDAQPGQPT